MLGCATVLQLLKLVSCLGVVIWEDEGESTAVAISLMDLSAHTAKPKHKGKDEDEDEDKDREKDRSNVFWTSCAQKQMILALTLLLLHPPHTITKERYCGIRAQL